MEIGYTWKHFFNFIPILDFIFTNNLFDKLG